MTKQMNVCVTPPEQMRYAICVELDSDDVEITHLNLNDNTVEGIAHKIKKVISVQHHPEACPGPNDSHYFFKRFSDMIKDSLDK